MEENKPEKPEDDEGSSLPGTAGVLVNVANSKPFTALFGPAFGKLGDYWGERMEHWVETKRAKNIDAHIKKVNSVENAGGELKEPTERQAEAMLEWAGEAQKVDPEREDDLAALWQGILGRIYRDEDTEYLVSILKQMNRGDAKALLEMPKGWFRREDLDPVRVEKFQRLGVLASFNWRQAIPSTLPLALMVVLISVTIAYAFPALLTVREGEAGPTSAEKLLAAMSVPLAFIPIFVLATVFFGPIVRRLSSVRLSQLGLQLRDSGSRFYKAAP